MLEPILKEITEEEYNPNNDDHIKKGCYKIEGGELIRNGSSARYTSLGKLYTAYKKIHKLD